jgi:hypothetical protein
MPGRLHFWTQIIVTAELVDEGSADSTWKVIEGAKLTCPQLVGIMISARRGHQIALTAGLEASPRARNWAILTMAKFICAPRMRDSL